MLVFYGEGVTVHTFSVHEQLALEADFQEILFAESPLAAHSLHWQSSGNVLGGT